MAQAKIPNSTFYDYLEEHPDFTEQIEWWQQYPIMIAKHSVVTQMNKDGKLALEYLKAKCKKEFGNDDSINVSVNTNNNIGIDEKLIRSMNEAIRKDD